MPTILAAWLTTILVALSLNLAVGPSVAAPINQDKTRRLTRPLKGFAERSQIPGRVERPQEASGEKLTGKATVPVLKEGINEAAFQLGAAAAETNRQTAAEPVWLTPTPSPAAAPVLTGQAAEHKAESSEKAPPETPSGGGGGVGHTPSEAPAAKNFAGKKIMIRLKRFRALTEMEVVWEAATLANKMAKKGADVTILLDMEAVNSANRGDTNFTEYELHRGHKNDRFVSIQSLYRDFTNEGGHLLVSDRWLKYYSIPVGQLTVGATLVSDDEIADALLETGNILDF